MSDSDEGPRVAANDAAAGEEPEDLPTDPEIEALLEFEPVPRKRRVAGGWTPELQRRFVANIAVMGSRTQAAEALGREVAGASKLCRAVGGEGFSAACDAALELYERRLQANAARNPGRAWAEPLRSRKRRSEWDDDWEEEEVDERQAEQHRESIATKLLRLRRLYLTEISGDPAKRAAFEILTELPIDWDKAMRGEAQADEPYSIANQRQPDMILTAESGWSFGDCGYGPDKKAEQRAAIDAWRAKRGLPPVDWNTGEVEEGEE